MCSKSVGISRTIVIETDTLDGVQAAIPPVIPLSSQTLPNRYPLDLVVPNKIPERCISRQ